MSNENENGNDYENVFLSSNNFLAGEEEQIRLVFFTNENTLKECMIKNQKYSLPLRTLNFLLKFLPCILYIIQVIRDEPTNSRGCCHICEIHSSTDHFESNVNESSVHWERLLFVNRTHGLWILQIAFAVFSLIQSILTIYLMKRSCKLSIEFFLSILIDLISSLPFIFTIIYPTKLRCIFIPSFLCCWQAKTQIEGILADLHKPVQRTTHAIFHRTMKVFCSTFCIIFTSICGFQHLQRGGYRHLTLFESLWFVVVTFSTIGYGDYKPDIWPSQAFMIIMIIISLIVIPIELERLVNVWLEQKKLGGTYSQFRAQREKHVVVCTTSMKLDVIMDFLNEFYAHQKSKNHYVCLLSTSEMDSSMKNILQMPMWARHVIYIQGSALKDLDLARCRIKHAEACFILAPKTYKDVFSADRHTIMCSWAVKNFAPKCKQFVQIYRPENKVHVRFAEIVVCLDELKYAILGNNILIPGISTLITLLIHTSRGQEGKTSANEWQKAYGQFSGNEIYDIKLKESNFFKECNGKTFCYASCHAYKKYGVCLVGISSQENHHLLLNPGSQHIMKENDICYYLSITEEKNSLIVKNKVKNIKFDEGNKISNGYNMVEFRKPSIDESIINTGTQLQYMSHELNYVVRPSLVLPYIETSTSHCYLMSVKRNFCCLHLLSSCPHYPKRSLSEYQWLNKTVLLCADNVSYGLYNFIVSLRRNWISETNLKPIIILIEKEPDTYFLETLSYFPLVYWILGSSESIDNLLIAGILFADQIVVINKEENDNYEDDICSDSKTILTVQKIYRLFPHVKIITEIRQSSNLRFAFFSPEDKYTFSISDFEKNERAHGSNMSYIFRLPFAAGNVFYTNMFDTLLYQSFVKSYLINFFRLLLGIDETPESGHLECYQFKEKSIETYGKMYKIFSEIYFTIPIGIYRTLQSPQSQEYNIQHENDEITQMIKNRIITLGLPFHNHENEKSRISFVLINPSYKFKLQENDLIYVLCPPTPTDIPIPLFDNDQTIHQDINWSPPGISINFGQQYLSRENTQNSNEQDYERNDYSPLL